MEVREAWVRRRRPAPVIDRGRAAEALAPNEAPHPHRVLDELDGDPSCIFWG